MVWPYAIRLEGEYFVNFIVYKSTSDFISLILTVLTRGLLNAFGQ